MTLEEAMRIVMKMKPWLDRLRAYDMGEWDPGDFKELKNFNRREKKGGRRGGRSSREVDSDKSGKE